MESRQRHHLRVGECCSAFQRGGVPRAASTLDNASGESSQRRFRPSCLTGGTSSTAKSQGHAARLQAGADLDRHARYPGGDGAFRSIPRRRSSGHLLFNQGGTLMAQRFDATRQFTADSFPILELQRIRR